MHLLCATHTLAPFGALSAQTPTLNPRARQAGQRARTRPAGGVSTKSLLPRHIQVSRLGVGGPLSSDSEHNKTVEAALPCSRSKSKQKVIPF